jgi:hypothetical protein
MTGLLLDEAGPSITLADQKGESRIVLRRDIEELVSNNRSQMPENLAENLTLQQMSDLIAFLANIPQPHPDAF